MADLDQQFIEFHQQNPRVYTLLVDMARQLRKRGHRKAGMKMLFEVLRWQHMMKTADPHSDFKLNNNYHSRYARLIMQREPDLKGFFEVRELHS